MKKELTGILNRKGSDILFVGVGNVLRNDDGAGVYIVSQIETEGRFSKLLVEASIENYISKINSLDPDILIIADCIDFNRIPGFSGLVPVSRIKEFNISSHNISLRRVADHLKMEVHVIGVQPSDLRVGENLTPPVREAADKIILMLNEIIKSTG
ncbi:MAG: hydrogenase maturation protease [Bacteroidales bacterium]